jgi:hypothetical protein
MQGIPIKDVTTYPTWRIPKRHRISIVSTAIICLLRFEIKTLFKEKLVFNLGLKARYIKALVKHYLLFMFSPPKIS